MRSPHVPSLNSSLLDERNQSFHVHDETEAKQILGRIMARPLPLLEELGQAIALKGQ